MKYMCTVLIRSYPCIPLRHGGDCAIQANHVPAAQPLFPLEPILRIIALMWAFHSISLRISCEAYSNISACTSNGHGKRSHDKWVFEQNLFESSVNRRRKKEIRQFETDDEDTGLVPTEWISLQVGLNKTKAEKKKERQLQEIEERKLKALEMRQKMEQLEHNFGLHTSGRRAGIVNETIGSNYSIVPQSRKQENPPELHIFADSEESCVLHDMTELTKAYCEKWPALHMLASSGQCILLDGFLQSQINVNLTDEDGYTPIQRAVLARKETAVNQLLRAGADVKVCDNDGASLLHFSAQTGSLNLVRLFIKKGLNVNQSDEYGWTPLHIATLTGKEEIVRHLLMNGADKHLRTKDGYTPLDICLTLGKAFRTYTIARSLKLLPK